MCLFIPLNTLKIGCKVKGMGLINKCVYIDNNATTRIDPLVLESMLPFLSEHYGNASSRLHPHGWIAKAALEKGMAQVAALLCCAEDELIITSGATESVNLALLGITEAYAHKGNHIITLKTEHKAVLDTCAALEKKGVQVTYLNVDKEGLLDTDELLSAIRPQTILVSVMAANNETGVIQDLEKISGICKERGIVFFSDATQYVGKMRCDVKELGIDAMALSAHKFYGPKGIGALYISKKGGGLKLNPQIFGGGHQNGLRSGTLNVPGIVGMGRAAELAASLYWEESSRVSALRSGLEHQLLDIEGLRINGSTRNRLYNTSNLLFPPHMDLSTLFHRFAFSSGSACSSASTEPSHVLMAMGLEKAEIKNSFRFSFGRFNTIEERDALVKDLLECHVKDRIFP
jgi:cysteine desulfurase